MKAVLLFLILLSACSHNRKPEIRRFVFVDVGAANGMSIDEFKKTRLYKNHSWKIYAVEPAPVADQIRKDSDIEVIRKAAWTYDGTIEFFKTIPEYETRNSVYHIEPFNREKEVIPCIDYSNWLRSNFSKDDYVIMSLDVAGAEIDILQDMIKKDVVEYVDRLYVEISYEMMKPAPGAPETEELVLPLINEFRRKGVLYDGDSVEDVLRERYTWQDEL